ncbi:uncharacterized protein [Spinacia oleracea]|uniref:CCHC-type domain-containing protein n=1 Tax=Spinacia oleracea TaxID=3562 RepID=A0ABM3R5M7_SPIOL|nr:uncharacterized protein LOC130466237 [Spinacia oleracea]
MGGEGKTPIQLIHDASSIYYLHLSEGPSNSLSKYLLKEQNDDIWEKAIVNALEGKNKYGFVNGDWAKPKDETGAEFAAWKANNSTICYWIFNSVDESIQPSIVSHKIAKDMWQDIKERFCVSNGPRLNQLKSEYHSLRQKGLSVVSYYNKFVALWNELYGKEDVICGCTCEAAAKLRARAERDKTHDFVLGLDDEQYKILRTQILSMDHFPTLNKAYSLVSQEEQHTDIIRDRDDKTKIVSFAVQSTTHSATPSAHPTPPVSLQSTPPTCTHCGKYGHDYERCYQRVGFPPGMRNRRGGRGRGGRGRGGGSGGRGQSASSTANAAQHSGGSNTDQSRNNATASTSSDFSNDQMQRIITLLEGAQSNDKLFGPHNEDDDWPR